MYCCDCDIAAPFEEGPEGTTGEVAPHACDDEAAERLWTASEALLDAA